jgi:cellulose synthase (UDP-forming)
MPTDLSALDSELARPAWRAASYADLSEPVLRGTVALQFYAALALWLAINVNFWGWWFTSAFSTGFFVFGAITFALFMHSSFRQLRFVFAAAKMRRIKTDLAPPPGKRVLMATTFVPGNESVEVLEQTLRGMIAQDYPHDVWVADEGFDRAEAQAVRRLVQRLDDELTERYRAEHTKAVPMYDDRGRACYAPSYRDLTRKPVNVRYFSRWNIARYQAAEPPFRARTKSGNYNAMLDFILNAVGVEYDILCQLDTDHVPQENYLDHVLVAFNSDDVAYVAAPSINRRCLYDNWASLGRLHKEAAFHGMMQMGLACDGAPLIMGSHVTYDLHKLREKGGFQESRAEDILHTLTFAAMDQRHGRYKGVFVPQAHAVGYGLDSFAESVDQSVAWSEGLTRILFENFLFRMSKQLSWRRKLSFAAHLSHYIVDALPYLLLSVLPAVMLVFNFYGPHAPAAQFSWRYVLLALALLPLWWFGKRYGLLRPTDAKLKLSYFALVELTHWPWHGIGAWRGFVQALTKKVTPFKLTSKGLHNASGEHYSIRYFLPHLTLVLINWAGILFYWVRYWNVEPFNTMVFWSLGIAGLYAGVFLLVTVNHLYRLRRQQLGWRALLRARWQVTVAALAVNGANLWLSLQLA